MKTLRNLFLDELADMYDAERRLVKALSKLAKAATCLRLRGAIESHVKETESHVRKLEQVFHSFDEKTRRKTSEATAGLLEECDEIAADFKDSPAINAALISAAQKVEHYEMASYGCLHEWAELLGNEEAARLLEAILQQETAADETLSGIARDRSNKEALSTFEDEDFEWDALETNEPPARQPSRRVQPESAARVHGVFTVR